MTSVSAVIPVHNGEDYVAEAVRSVLAQTFPVVECIVVDDGSSDGTCEWLRAAHPEVRLVTLERNQGFCRAINAGIRAARAPFVETLNNDTVVTAGWLEGLVAWALHDWPKVGLVGAVTNASRAPQEILSASGA